MTKQVVLAVGFVASVLAIASCSSEDSQSSSGCTSVADCKSSEVCQNGKCIPLIDPDAGTDAGEDSSSQDVVNEAQACLGQQPPASPCVCPGDCEVGSQCVDELTTGYPGGFCARICTPTDACPGDLLCVELEPGDPTTAGCVKPCTESTDCPAGSVCQTLVAGGELLCGPLCQSDSDCPALGTCDKYTGSCGNFGNPNLGKADTGEPCTSGADCISTFCINVAPFTDGYCSAFCSLSKQGCPTGSWCTANWSNVGDVGVCFKTCNDVSECQTGLQCAAYTDGVKVCRP
jgi:hypothetical protein